MKRIISIMTAALCLMLFPVTTFAADGNNGLFISESDARDIATNIYDQQAAYPFIFGTENVIFDFEHITPVYEISDTIQGVPSSLSEITVFADRYMLPATDLQGNILGIVTLEQNQGKWEIASFKEGINQTTLAILSGDQNVSLEDSKVYYLEIGMLEDAGLLYVSDSLESYTSLTAKADRLLTFTPSGTSDLLSEIADVLTLEENPNNGAVTLHAQRVLPFASAGILVVLLAVGSTIYLLKRRPACI